MRYVVYGAGAVGSIIGAYLHTVGLNVVLVARPGHAARIEQRGLAVRSPSQAHRVSIRTAISASDLTPFQSDDAVLLTVKSQHTDTALTELRQAGVSSTTPVFCMQNSVVNERIAARCFDNVYGVVTALPAMFLVDGEVIGADVSCAGVLEIGRYPEGVDEVARNVARDLQRAGFRVELSAQIMPAKYTKLLTNIGNSLFAIVGLQASRKELDPFLSELRAEAISVWERAGITYEPEKEFRERVLAQAQDLKLPGGVAYGGSTWQSLARRSGTVETDYLEGEVVREAKRVGTEAPLNDLLCRIANEMAEDGLEPGSYTIAELRRLAAVSI